MELIWKYLSNQFTQETLRNFKKAMKLSNYHDAALAEAQLHDPAMVPIYARYHPLHESLRQRYNAWKAAGGTQKGKTAALAGAFINCKNVAEEVRRHGPDVVLMDINMPEYDGLYGLQIIKETRPETEVIMFTVFEEEDKIFASLEAGASGYLPKPANATACWPRALRSWWSFPRMPMPPAPSFSMPMPSR